VRERVREGRETVGREGRGRERKEWVGGRGQRLS